MSGIMQVSQAVSADLAAVQIIDFIEYSNSGADFDVVEGGYVTPIVEEDIPFAS